MNRMVMPFLSRPFLLACLLTAAGVAQAREKAPQIKSLSTRRVAPSLDRAGRWYNTAGPIRLKQLRGKFVLLDFWTHCCINCQHTLPELQKLERAYRNQLVVIGVHSPKFTNERDDASLRDAILREEIEHPVVNDERLVLWRRYGISGWPSLRIIDPQGFLIGTYYGEAKFEMLDAFFKRRVRFYRSKGLLDETPLHFDLERKKERPRPLRFPGKVLADEAGGRLFIADSGHNRIVIAALDGKLLHVVGSGVAGHRDGSYAEAAFDHPQGMAIDGDKLYVADTENHRIRLIDLKTKRVTTIAGNGKFLPNTASSKSTARATAARLSSPWALSIHDGQLYIAMAGRHEIWKMALPAGRIGLYAGNGTEDIVDGTLLPRRRFQKGSASFAQPSALASDGSWLFVADSEGSSIRAVPFRRSGRVLTVIGTAHLKDERLFTFGDRDGGTGVARFQHPVGLVHHRGQLYVADTYNHKIKRIDLKKRQVDTIAGTGKPGRVDAPAQFNEPTGLSAAGGKLYIADTNNHAIRVIDLSGENAKRGPRTTTLDIKGLQPPKPAKAPPALVFPGAKRHSFGTAKVKPTDGAVRMAVELRLPEGWKLNPLAPMSYLVEVDGAAGKPVVLKTPTRQFEIKLPVDGDAGSRRIKVSLTYYYCQAGAGALCKIGRVGWSGEVKFSADAPTDRIELTHAVR